MHEKGTNPHWHGLTKEDLLDITNQLESPAIIMKSRSDKESIILVTENIDSDKMPIIISLKPNGRGVYNLEKIDTNYLTSIYGKNNFKNFLKKNIEENKILYVQKNKIQNLELFSKLQLFEAFPDGFEFNEILHQIGGLVNTKIEENSISDENYWVVEYNETSSRVPDYKGRVLDETGDVTEHLRIDIGDGNRANLKDFIYLKEQINNKGKKDSVINIKFNV